MKLCQITTNPKTNISGYGAEPNSTLETSTAQYGGPQLSHQIQIAHIKYKLLTSNTNCSRQIQTSHIKYKILTSNTNYSHQKQITHIKYKILTSNTNYSHQKKNCSHQIQITHIKNKLLTSKTRFNGQRSENENYVQFSLGLDPTTILFLHVVLSSRRDVLQQLRKKC